jgi:hypothetical protein
MLRIRMAMQAFSWPEGKEEYVGTRVRSQTQGKKELMMDVVVGLMRIRPSGHVGTVMPASLGAQQCKRTLESPQHLVVVLPLLGHAFL